VMRANDAAKADATEQSNPEIQSRLLVAAQDPAQCRARTAWTCPPV
jgi:hypothetical protein